MTKNFFCCKRPTTNNFGLDLFLEKFVAEQYQPESRIMVWDAISNKGKLPLLLIDSGVRQVQNYYIKHVLQVHLLEHAYKLYGEEYFCFQQDSAPRALKEFSIGFHYLIGYMLGKIDNTKHVTLSQFKTLSIKICDEIPQQLVRA
jgi:hypothetical protein